MNEPPPNPLAADAGPEPAPAQHAPTDAKTIIRRLGPAGVLALVAAVLPGLGGFVLLGLVKWIAPWLRDHDGAGLMIYVVGFAVMAGLALLPTYAQAFVGGWAFGFSSGLLAALLGLLGASSLGYVIARRASGDRVVSLIEEHPKWKAVYEALLGGNFARRLFIVFLVRLPPNSPFSMTNLAMAAAKVGTLPYLLGTLLGIAPRTAAAVWIGATVGSLDFGSGGSKWLWIAGIVITVIVIGIIGQMANQAIARVTSVQLNPGAACSTPEPPNPVAPK